MSGTVTFNSVGAKSTASPATPAPPISNCLGKMVFLIATDNFPTPTISAPTGATYFLLGTGATDSNFAVYYKNGENPEPTPSVTFTGGASHVAQITVLDIAPGFSFPTIAVAGDGRLATHNIRNGTVAGINYDALTVVGGGYLIQFGQRDTTLGSGITSVATTGGFVQIAFAASGANIVVMSAQLLDSDTVNGVNASANVCAITTDASTTNLEAHALTVEMSFLTTPVITNFVPQGNRIYVLP